MKDFEPEATGLTGADAPSPSPRRLKQFKITTGTSGLFRNGRMQAVITVKALGESPRDSTKTAAVTQDQLRTVCLIHYNNEERLANESGWYIDSQSNEYDHIVTGGSIASFSESATEDSNWRSKTFYVRNQAIANNTYQIGAEITLNKHSSIYQHISERDEFKQPIDIQLLTPLTYDLSQWTFQKNERVSDRTYPLHREGTPCNTSETVLGPWKQVNYEPSAPYKSTKWRTIHIEGINTDSKTPQFRCFNHNSQMDNTLRLLFLWSLQEKRTVGFKETPLYEKSNGQKLYCAHACPEIETTSAPDLLTVSVLSYEKPANESKTCDWKLTKDFQHRFECLDNYGNSAGFWHIRPEKEEEGTLALSIKRGWSPSS